MNKSSFDEKFQQLTKHQEAVLEYLLSGASDKAAAARFCIQETTYRKHIQQIAQKFGFKAELGERSDKRSALTELFREHKPEWVSAEALAKYIESDNLAPVVAQTSPVAEPSQVSNLNFVGRQGAIADLNAFINSGQRVILIFGEGGKGKSMLAKEFCKAFDLVLRHDVGQETQNVTSIENKVDEWLRRYLDEEPAQDFDVSLTRLLRKLQDSRQRIVIWIDNLEPALEQGLFVAAHRNYVKLLRGLTEVGLQTVTLITSREQICEPSIKGIELYELQELQAADWHEFYLSHGIATGVAPEIETISETSALYQMHNAYGGNAEAMSIFKGDICRECKGNLEAYWQKNKAELLRHPKLANLIESQFNKLQQDSEWEYRLLCRMGCFRFQDVPYVPEQGLLELLWDAPERQKARIVKALYDRCLIKLFDEGYYLHPVVRAEAISRLRSGEEWEVTNRKAAQSWIESVEAIEKPEDALTAFEAYHHYISIDDLRGACNVIIERRPNKLAKHSALGISFYRLGLLNQMISSINLVKDNVDPGYSQCRIFNILGDLLWLTGSIHEAIFYHDESGKIASNCLKLSKAYSNDIQTDFGNLNVVALANKGLCKIDLWELEEAASIFNECLLLTYEIKCHLRYRETSWFCLAYLSSCIGSKEKATDFLYKSECSETALTEWGRGYKFLFLGMTYKNLDLSKKSIDTYNQAIEFSEEYYYPQVKAKALNGLAELYREQQDFSRALLHHIEAVNLLEKIGAKCDFADALFQRALTYQAIGEAEKSQADSEEAIRLFTGMNAPRQVERVQQTMNGTSNSR
ncbi:hypothetical protein H6F76_22560 [Leptolyngbya sp. FACHB-321]|uniref:tetratricopeptide repeat protein n=1 Tax=Leptolyngbya sp. FACHB-321 TaxID=2692807 RepID=UPI0016842FC3|nr:tetratricopeptide repeat protein [Leptolyngbya sp. FACHB-321]MBD2037740.1 hypothetical protein [Leptolyngbya sp. FACHB-321]